MPGSSPPPPTSLLTTHRVPALPPQGQPACLPLTRGVPDPPHTLPTVRHQMAAKQQDGTGMAVWKAVKPFVNGGLSGMTATCVIQPVDMVKVRLQLGAKGSMVGAP